VTLSRGASSASAAMPSELATRGAVVTLMSDCCLGLDLRLTLCEGDALGAAAPLDLGLLADQVDKVQRRALPPTAGPSGGELACAGPDNPDEWGGGAAETEANAEL
jgi:hypothetical protein